MKKNISKNTAKSIDKKAAIYIRVSTHHQIDKDSLPFQREELINYCKYVLHIDNFEVFEDAGYSAKNTDRPKYQEMMTRIRQNEFTHLMVWKLDRISRNLRDFTEMWDELKEYNVSFISKMEQFDTTTMIGEAMLKIALVFAELERKQTAERVYGLMLSRAEKGQWNGAPTPLGYSWNDEEKKIAVNQSEAEVVSAIFNQYEKTSSTSDVARWLIDKGYATKRGGIWGSKGVSDILHNPIYCGTLRYNYKQSGRGQKKDPSEVISVPNAVPSIVTQEQWNKVQQMLTANFKGKITNKENKHIHILSGLIRCAYCGKNYVSALNSRPHKHGYLPSLYRCGTRWRSKTCTNDTISGLQIEPFILEYIRTYLSVLKENPQNAQQALKIALDNKDIKSIEFESLDVATIKNTANTQINSDSVCSIETTINEIRQKKTKIEQAVSRLDDAYFFSEGMQAISKTDYLIKRSELQQKLQKLDSELNKIIPSKPIANDNMQQISQYFMLNTNSSTSMREMLPFLDKQVLKTYLNNIIEHIDVAGGRVIQISFKSDHGETIHKIIYE